MAKAKARSEAPASRRPPQKSQGNPILIIFMVFFILISLTLGIFLYLAQEKIHNAENLAKTATADAAKNKTLNDNLNRYYEIVFKNVVDAGTVNAQDREDMAKLEGDISSASGGSMPNKEFQAARDEALKILGGKQPDPGTAASYFKGLVAQLKDQLAKTEASRVKFEDDYKTTKAAFEAYQKDWNRERFDNEWKAEAVKLKATHDQRIVEMQKTIDKGIADIADVKRDFDVKITAELAKHAADKKATEARVDEAIAKVEKFRQDQEEKSEQAKRIVIDDKSPKVFQVQPNSDLVYIDIGTGDRVSPDLTFNVYRRGPGGKPDLTPIASLRVVSVVGKGVSMARITRVAKPEFNRTLKNGVPATPEDPEYWITDSRDFYKSRSPVQAGDLLNNPAYRPRDVVHVFLSGVFDLDGDGHDDLDTFRRMLREMGAEVDGYLDPANNYEIKGRIDYVTDYLIIGTVPLTGGKGSNLKENSDKVEAEARKKGLHIRRLNTFLMEMGFTDVRVPANRGQNGAAAAAPGNGKKEEAPKKEEEKKPAKDEGEEEKKKDK
jgi:hypothetical protein